MSGYLHGLTATGCAPVDRLLAAIRNAGDNFHHTEDWWEKFGDDDASCIDRINAAAKAAADAFRAPPLAAPAPSAMAEAPIVARLRDIARPLGWAITSHGTMDRDIDVVAIPWTAEAIDGRALIDALCRGTGYELFGGNPTHRPHGRRSVLLKDPAAEHEQDRHNRGEFIGPVHPKGRWFPPCIDLSVMPSATPPAAPAAVTDDVFQTALAVYESVYLSDTPEPVVANQYRLRVAIAAALAAAMGE